MSSLELYGAESSVFESAGASLALHVRLAAIYVDLKTRASPPPVWPVGPQSRGHVALPHFMTAEIKLPTRASGVPQLLIQDTVVRSRSRR